MCHETIRHFEGDTNQIGRTLCMVCTNARWHLLSTGVFCGEIYLSPNGEFSCMVCHKCMLWSDIHAKQFSWEVVVDRDCNPVPLVVCIQITLSIWLKSRPKICCICLGYTFNNAFIIVFNPNVSTLHYIILASNNNMTLLPQGTLLMNISNQYDKHA